MALPLLFILRPAVVAVVHFETGYRGRGAGVGRGCDAMLFGGGGGLMDVTNRCRTV